MTETWHIANFDATPTDAAIAALAALLLAGAEGEDAKNIEESKT